jgi:hypothetical protein
MRRRDRALPAVTSATITVARSFQLPFGAHWKVIDENGSGSACGRRNNMENANKIRGSKRDAEFRHASHQGTNCPAEVECGDQPVVSVSDLEAGFARKLIGARAGCAFDFAVLLKAGG